MATPEEIALKAIDMQAKALHKIISLLQNTAKKLVGDIATLVDGLKALLAKLNQIRQFLPSALLSAAKKGAKVLLKAIRELPQRVKTMVRFMKNLAKAIKAGLSNTVVSMISLSLNMIKALLAGLVQYLKTILDVVKPLERLRSALKQMESMIRSVLENVADILAQIAVIANVKSTLAMLQKKLKKAMDYIGETEKNLVKLGKAMG